MYFTWLAPNYSLARGSTHPPIECAETDLTFPVLSNLIDPLHRHNKRIYSPSWWSRSIGVYRLVRLYFPFGRALSHGLLLYGCMCGSADGS